MAVLRIGVDPADRGLAGFRHGTPPKVVRATEASADWGSVFLGRRTYLPGSFVARWSVPRLAPTSKGGAALPDSISTRNKTARHERRRKRMLEVERADGVVDAAISRVQGLDRLAVRAMEERSLPPSCFKDSPSLAHSRTGRSCRVSPSRSLLLDEDERTKYREFQESIRRAADNARSAEEQSSSNWVISGGAEVEIDPAPRSDSRTATLESVIADEDLARGGRPKPSCISSTTRSSTGPRSWWSVRRRLGNACGRSCGRLPL